MPSKRYLLEFKHLGLFVHWCISNDIEIAHPTGDWQVLKVKTKNGWDAIYIRIDPYGYYSGSQNILTIVRKFLKEANL